MTELQGPKAYLQNFVKTTFIIFHTNLPFPFVFVQFLYLKARTFPHAFG